MPKQATGHVRWVNGVAIARIRVTSTVRESFPMPTCRTETEAAARAQVLAEVAKRMRPANVALEAARKTLNLIAAASARSLPSALQIAGELTGGQLGPAVAGVPTFKQIGDDWTSGKLAARYPDQVRVKRSVHTDISRLDLYVYPVIGGLPIDRVTLDACEDVMRKLPAKLSTATRHRVGTLVARVLTLAVYPLRLIERSPIPKGFLPAPSKAKALAYLYPDEDRRLLACSTVPLAFRLLWGFLDREGMREGEALALTFGELDLERGAVRLDKNKTDDPRAWALNAGVAAALRAYRERYRPNATAEKRVFLDPAGRPLNKYGLADLLRSHLLELGLLRERPELFTTTAERRRIRVHDLRGTFVTLALANGRSESWISDRTGHRSSQMIARYKRNARTFDELNLGELMPLNEAIPELSIGHGLATEQQEGSSLSDRADEVTVERDSGKDLVGHLGFEPRANGLRMLAGSGVRANFGMISEVMHF